MRSHLIDDRIRYAFSRSYMPCRPSNPTPKAGMIDEERISVLTPIVGTKDERASHTIRLTPKVGINGYGRL